jgi:predicted transcriptional regulator
MTLCDQTKERPVQRTGMANAQIRFIRSALKVHPAPTHKAITAEPIPETIKANVEYQRWQSAIIAQGHADIDAGLGMDGRGGSGGHRTGRRAGIVLAQYPARAYYQHMDIETVSSHTIETDTAREARIRWEAEEIAKGKAEIEAGLCYDWDDLKAWYDQLDIDPDAPMPPMMAPRK